MAILAGLFRVTRQAELRHLPSGEAVASLSLAYNYGVKKDERGFLPSVFVDAGLWGKRAESLHMHLERGKQISAVLEDLHLEFFNKADGTPGVKLAARVQSIEFVSVKREDAGDRPRGEPSSPSPATEPSTRVTPGPAAGGSGFEDMDDDIPFSATPQGAETP